MSNITFAALLAAILTVSVGLPLSLVHVLVHQ